MIVIAGIVSAQGEVVANQGDSTDFSARRFAGGVYLVDFTPKFTVRPTVVVTVDEDGAGMCSATVSPRGNQQIAVRTYPSTGAGGTTVDRAFHFVVIGRV